jgi:predicted RNA polymerase sigma factor
MCCHASLTTASAIALTLRAVGGLTTAEIAAAFLVPEATMAQRISRAKHHDEAPSAKDTDWPQVLTLYGLLKGMSANPMVTLNHAVAAAMVHGPKEGLALLDALQGDRRIAEHHRLDAIRAHLLEMSGDKASSSQILPCSGRENHKSARTELPSNASRKTDQQSKQFFDLVPRPTSAAQ